MRVFTAIQLHPEISLAVEKGFQSYKPFESAIRWVNFKTIHSTLHFFSNLTDSQIKDLIKVSEAVIAKSNSFPITLNEPGFFPDPKHPRVFWWGIEVCDSLEKLHQELSAAYQKLKLPLEDRAYKAHFTLGRFKNQEPVLDEVIQKLKGTWKLSGKQMNATSIKLFKSPALSEGYPVLHEFFFKKGMPG